MSRIITFKEGKIGELRKFADSDKIYEIREILESPNISMYWRWDSGVCPYCKKRIIREIKHDFYRIEILVDESKKDNDVKLNDIYISGDTLDNRKMKIPIGNIAFRKVLSKSKKYMHLIKDI